MSKVSPIILQPLAGAGRDNLPAPAGPAVSAGPQTAGSFEQVMVSTGSAKRADDITGSKMVKTAKQSDDSQTEKDEDSPKQVDDQNILGQVTAGLAALADALSAAAGIPGNSDATGTTGISSESDLSAVAAPAPQTPDLPAGNPTAALSSSDPAATVQPSSDPASVLSQTPAAAPETGDAVLSSGSGLLPEPGAADPESTAGLDLPPAQTPVQNTVPEPAAAAAATETAVKPAATAAQTSDTINDAISPTADDGGTAPADSVIPPENQAAAGFDSGSDTDSPAAGEDKQESGPASYRLSKDEHAAAGSDHQISWISQADGSAQPGTPASVPAGQAGNTSGYPIETGEPMIESIETGTGLEGDSRQMTVHLKPDAYGTVQIRLFQNQDGLVAQIWTDKPATCDLLQSQLPSLVKQIQDQGVTISGASVFLDMGQSGGQAADQNTQSASVRQLDLRQIRTGRRGVSIRQEQSLAIDASYGPAQSIINYYA
ncbi:MAG: flagellar hook-length control protein FliK [Clostridiaceae bacterium]|nr:flagellar hook-length control protein FliK [Clostridiaceae bacterium]